MDKKPIYTLVLYLLRTGDFRYHFCRSLRQRVTTAAQCRRIVSFGRQLTYECGNDTRPTSTQNWSFSCPNRSGGRFHKFRTFFYNRILLVYRISNITDAGNNNLVARLLERNSTHLSDAWMHCSICSLRTRHKAQCGPYRHIQEISIHEQSNDECDS